jgi:hypothetical protein
MGITVMTSVLLLEKNPWYDDPKGEEKRKMESKSSYEKTVHNRCKQ